MQDAFAEENGLTVLSSLLSTSKSSSLLQAVLRCLGAYVQHACVPGIGAGPLGSTGQPAQPGAHGRAAGNVMLLERSRGVSAAVRLSSAYGHPEYTPAEAKAVSLAALDLLLKVSAIPEMRTTLRYVEPLLNCLFGATLGQRATRHRAVCLARHHRLYQTGSAHTPGL